MDVGCDMLQNEYLSSTPKHMILKIIAMTLLVVAVRLVATAPFAGGCGEIRAPGQKGDDSPLLEQGKRSLADLKLRGPCAGSVEGTRCR